MKNIGVGKVEQESVGKNGKSERLGREKINLLELGRQSFTLSDGIALRQTFTIYRGNQRESSEIALSRPNNRRRKDAQSAQMQVVRRLRLCKLVFIAGGRGSDIGSIASGHDVSLIWKMTCRTALGPLVRCRVSIK